MLHGGDGFELLLIAAVALIVVGPKDLPVLLRKLGQFVGKMRGMAAEFRASFDEMARQSELDELRKEVEAMRQGQFADQAARATGTDGVNQIFHEIGDSLGDIQLHPPMSHQYDAAAMQASSEMVGETVKTEVVKAPVAKIRATKAKSAPAKAATRPRPARSAAAKPLAVKAPARAKAVHPAKAKPIARPKPPAKPKSAPAAKAVAAKVPRAPVQRAKPAAAPKARSPK